MTKTQLLFPMAFCVFYIGALGIYLFKIRLKAVKSGQVPYRYFKAYTGHPPEERMHVVGRHYDNQFQLPVLFLATCAVNLALDSTNTTTITLAWAFVLSRLFHSWVHLGSNKIPQRALAFALGWIAIVLLWAQLVYLTVS